MRKSVASVSAVCAVSAFSASLALLHDARLKAMLMTKKRYFFIFTADIICLFAP
jgi:hypothetical protein